MRWLVVGKRGVWSCRHLLIWGWRVILQAPSTLHDEEQWEQEATKLLADKIFAGRRDWSSTSASSTSASSTSASSTSASSTNATSTSAFMLDLLRESELDSSTILSDLSNCPEYSDCPEATDAILKKGGNKIGLYTFGCGFFLQFYWTKFQKLFQHLKDKVAGGNGLTEKESAYAREAFEKSCSWNTRYHALTNATSATADKDGGAKQTWAVHIAGELVAISTALGGFSNLRKVERSVLDGSLTESIRQVTLYVDGRIEADADNWRSEMVKEKNEDDERLEDLSKELGQETGRQRLDALGISIYESEWENQLKECLRLGMISQRHKIDPDQLNEFVEKIKKLIASPDSSSFNFYYPFHRRLCLLCKYLEAAAGSTNFDYNGFWERVPSALKGPRRYQPNANKYLQMLLCVKDDSGPVLTFFACREQKCDFRKKLQSTLDEWTRRNQKDAN